MASWRPRVSVVIPVLDEERYLRRCLASVAAQTYPGELIEVIVADGRSSDATHDIVRAVASDDPRIRLVDNPRRTQAAGLNVAIAASSGEVIARLDGHAAWSPQHIERCVEILERTGADNVGGTMAMVGEGAVGTAFALATRSRFGVGGATYRYAERECEVDTVWLGCFRRTALDRVGPFDERFPPHEDYELNHRLRTSGGRIVFSPAIPTTYWPRTSWRAIGRQYFRYGRGKVRVARHHPGVVRPHHLAPPTLVAGCAVAAAASLHSHRGRALTVGLAAAYAAQCVVAAHRVSRGTVAPVRRRVPLVLGLLHLAWGTGFWAGVAETLLPARRRS